MVTRQPDGKALVFRLVSERSSCREEKRREEKRREEKRRARSRERVSECSPFKQTDFSTDWASSNQIVLVGRSPAHVFWDIQ